MTFRELKTTSVNEESKMEEIKKIIRFEVSNDGESPIEISDDNIDIDSDSDFDDQHKEQETPTVRRLDQVRRSLDRYILPNFFVVFSRSAVDDEQRIVKELVTLAEGKSWVKEMIKEMQSLKDNET